MGPAPLLVVRGPQGEMLIPFAKSYLRRIDLDAKRVEMALPEGIVDLNSPEKSDELSVAGRPVHLPSIRYAASFHAASIVSGSGLQLTLRA